MSRSHSQHLRMMQAKLGGDSDGGCDVLIIPRHIPTTGSLYDNDHDESGSRVVVDSARLLLGFDFVVLILMKARSKKDFLVTSLRLNMKDIDTLVLVMQYMLPSFWTSDVSKFSGIVSRSAHEPGPIWHRCCHFIGFTENIPLSHWGYFDVKLQSNTGHRHETG